MLNMNAIGDRAVYSDCEKQHKVWRFSKVAEGWYVSQRADLMGQASHSRASSAPTISTNGRDAKPAD
jgi:hypothetical protein